MDDVSALLSDQGGVVARRQLLAAGLRPHDLERMLRRRELAPVHPGVFVDHTGEPSWHQRAWAGVLYAWPAALSHSSAVRAAEGPGRHGGEPGLIEVAVAGDRSLTSPAGVRVRRIRGLEPRVQWNLGPPRTRYEDALLDVASEAASDLEAIGLLADACGGRRTTAGRLATAAASRLRLRRRDWLLDVLTDVASGTCSVLEHGYLERVERGHGLPRGHRQSMALQGDSMSYQDVAYEDYGLIVELDGRLFHSSVGERDRDLERDLITSSRGGTTVRLGWGQVFERPCATAAAVGRLLQERGWAGRLRRCRECAGRN